MRSESTGASGCSPTARPPLPTAAIEDVFWAVDLEMGQRDLIDGTTATVLFVESSPPEEAEAPLREASSAPLREAPESGLRCVLAWVGDSTAVALDMRAAHGVPLAATRDHNPDSTEEQARMNRMQASRDDPASAAADDVKLFTRAFERAKAIAEQRPDGADSRRKCLFMNRSKPTESSHPFVVATEEHHAHPCYYDLQMTRSIGDWLAPIWCCPTRSFWSWTRWWRRLPPRHIGHDGLWDVCSHQTAAKVARKRETPQEAPTRCSPSPSARTSRSAASSAWTTPRWSSSTSTASCPRAAGRGRDLLRITIKFALPDHSL